MSSLAPPAPPPLGPADEILVEVAGELGPAARASLRCFRFVVPQGTAALSLHVDYAPRRSRDTTRNRQLVERAVDEQLCAAMDAGIDIADDVRGSILARPGLRALRERLRNLLNAVLVDATGAHRGRWDRNLEGASPDAVIAPGWAALGFVPGPLPAGEWQLTLEIHEVIDDAVHFQLRVAALGEAPPEDAHTTRRALPPPRREYYAAPPAGWLRGELHAHTTASDGLHAPEELVARAQAVGLDFLAVTDHNSTAGAKALGALVPAAEATSAPEGVALIAGCEVTTFGGHFLGLGLQRPPRWYEDERPLTVEEMVAEVRRQGGLFGLAHPFVLGAPICVGCRLTSRVPYEEVDLLEVWSRGNDDPLANRCALALFDRLRREGRRVTAVAGRDWHGPQQEHATAGMRFPATVVRAEPRPRAILDALTRGACYLSVGPALELALSGAGHDAILGEDLPAAAAGSPVSARVRVDALQEPAVLRLLVAGHVVREEAIAGPAVIEHEGLILAPGGARVELWAAETGVPLALTNPIDCLRA